MSTAKTNRELVRELSGQRRACFLLCDFHTHSPASYDVVSRPDLSDAEKEKLREYIGKTPTDWVKHQQDVLSAFPPAEYLDVLVQRRDRVVAELGIADYNKWAIVAFTDHNVCHYAAELASAAWAARKENQLFVLPGIELDVNFPLSAQDTASIHVLCIFSPGVSASDIRRAVGTSSGINWKEGNKLLTVSKLDEFVQNLRSHADYPALVIAAHVATSKGIQKETKGRLLTAKEAEVAHLEAEVADATNARERAQLQAQLDGLHRDVAAIDTDVLKLIGRCGFDALQVSSKADEKHYRRLHRYRPEHGRAVPIISSDAHSVEKIFVASDGQYPHIKLPGRFAQLSESEFFAEVKEKAIRFGETRFSYSHAGEVSHWIEGIEVVTDSKSAKKFWPKEDGLTLPFSRNLNCLIGGRGSGKSSVIEALAFLLNPDEARESGKGSSATDWYSRAYATLAGCTLRLCWKAIGENADPEFRKGVFISRYFDPNNRHSEPSVTDVNGSTLISPRLPAVQIFRFHDIEKAAEANGLRDLIDQISGCIDQIQRRIDAAVTALRDQNRHLLAVAHEINLLTQDGAPLRRYVKRKLEYVHVNKKEVKEHFDKLDSIEAAGKRLRQLRQRWDDISNRHTEAHVEELEKLILDVLAESMSGDEHLQSLSALVKGDDAALEKFVSTLRDLYALGNATEAEFEKQRQMLMEKYTAIRDELTQNGLPIGSKDREAKKKEFEESAEDLVTYRTTLERFQRILGERGNLFQELKDACRARTEARVGTAEMITKQLRQDLDETILKIEATARPMADVSAFERWLEKHLPAPRYKSQRIRSLLEGGLTPEILRDLLIGRRNDWTQMLVRDRGGKVSEGHISADEVETMRPHLEAIHQHDPEVAADSDQITAELYSELPIEIRDGLLEFPAHGEALALASALALDELIFDDMPAVFLNDRPAESESTLRPLSELSPGQRCSAVLPILLLNGRAPLIIDQPEDNLDNRLIRQVIVNVLGSIKLRRQVIVATHNPNIPVLGDSEQTVVLAAIDENQSQISTTGNLDERTVVAAITEIMEGGREAFQYRESIYQLHWKGPVETD